MDNLLTAIFPEINQICDIALRDCVIRTYEDALTTGGWSVDDMNRIPFTLDFPEFLFSYADHVKGVTQVAKRSAEVFNETYRSNPQYRLDLDLIIAGGLLHDVGKLLEYEQNRGGQYVKSSLGKSLRHPVLGSIIAYRNGCPAQLCHIIATHAAEGDCSRRTPESVVINKADFLNYDTICTIKDQQ